MACNDPLTLHDMVRDAPVECCLLTVVPIGVAFVQLMNSLMNGLSIMISVPVAFILIVFSLHLVTYQYAQYRVTRLENEAAMPLQ